MRHTTLLINGNQGIYPLMETKGFFVEGVKELGERGGQRPGDG